MTEGDDTEGEAGRPATPQRLDPPEIGSLSGRLFPPLPTEAEWSLDRLHALLDEIRRPQEAYATLHVGGTNGKGSVATVWASVLREEGRRVGLYTSPHLFDFSERFRVDGRSVVPAELLEAASELRDEVVRHGLTFFEAITVLAFYVFRRAGVEVAVLEVGLGGRLDATNVVRPEVCAVTNVGLDHVEYLGDTLESVAREKAGIAKEGVPFATAETDPTLVEVLRRVATDRGASFHHLDPLRSLRSQETGMDGSRFRMTTESWGELSLSTPLVGRHQIRNVALAVLGLDLLDPRLRPDVGSVIRGVRRAWWPGRFQVIRNEGRTWVFDVAHNTEATEALSDTVRAVDLPAPRIVVFGCLGDKDWRSMLGLIRPWADRALLLPPPGAPAGRIWDPEEAHDAFPEWTRVEWDLAAALYRAGELAGPEGSVVVTGSHRLVGGALRELEAPGSP